MTFLPLFIVSACQSLACPVCSTTTGEQVRAGIFNAGFIPTALMVLAPFPVFIGIILLLHFGFPWHKRSGQQEGEEHDYQNNVLPQQTAELP